MIRKSISGFAYIWMLIVFSILATFIGQWSVNYATLQQREKEQELIRIGSLYQAAITQYYNDSSVGYPLYITDLEMLLKVNSNSKVFRYLRKLENDPITNKEFEMIRNKNDGIIGVRSTSLKKPIKIKNFPEKFNFFEKANSYRDWIFLCECEK